MRGKKAKSIRRRVYGDASPRVRKYTIDGNGARRNVGLRAEYLAAKKRSQRESLLAIAANG